MSFIALVAISPPCAEGLSASLNSSRSMLPAGMPLLLPAFVLRLSSPASSSWAKANSLYDKPGLLVIKEGLNAVCFGHLHVTAFPRSCPVTQLRFDSSNDRSPSPGRSANRPPASSVCERLQFTRGN